MNNQALADWQDWWRTPEQQARAAFDKGDNEQLIRVAPDAAWQGVAEHESADYESAARTFDEVVTIQDLAGNTQEATRALYNRAVSEVRLGEYQKAVESFDQVLERNPEFTDARFNREIARQLLQQQQQSSSPPQAGNESDDDSESQDPSEQQTSSPDDEQPQSGEQQQSDSQAGEGSEQDESGAEQGDDSDASAEETEAEQLRDQQAAQDALDAEAQRGEDDDDQSDQDGPFNAAQREEPLTESEQATEQWLRRIPDDPAGLLRRKLEQSHRIEYPEVRNAQEPW